MVAQLQPREESAEIRHASPHVPRAHPDKVTQKRRGTTKQRRGFAVSMKKAASSAGLIATIVGIVAGTIAAYRQVHPLPPPPPPPADPRVAVDERAMLIRSSKNKQLELRVSLTLLNEGGSVAVIPRPTVSLGDALIPPDDVHFTFAGGTSEVIFPVSLHEGASTFAKQIICSIAEGHVGAWYQARLLRINLDFRPEGHDPISRCLVVIPPVTDDDRPVSSDESRCLTITDECQDFGESFTKRLSTRRTS